MKDALKPLITPLLDEGDVSPYVEEFAVSGLLAVYTLCFEQGRDVDIALLATQQKRMVDAVLSSSTEAELHKEQEFPAN